MSEPKRRLGDDIRLLAGMLGDTLREQEGEAHYALEERIRQVSKESRADGSPCQGKLLSILREVSRDLSATATVLKAFTTYFYLVNLAEVRHRVRILREREVQAEEAGSVMDETFLHAFQHLREEGIAPDQIQEMLDSLTITPVFTAHPTESQRKTVLDHLREMDRLLEQLELDPLTGAERRDLEEHLRRQILLLWQSDDTRDRKPTVMDEVRNTGIYYFEATLFEVVPEIYRRLERALSGTYPNHPFRIPTFLKYGSWIGGDRDGNPFVTSEVTRETLREHQEAILRQYNVEVDRLYHELSCSTNRVPASESLLESIARDRGVLDKDEQPLLERFANEPYRQKLLIMFRRLRATRELIRSQKSPLPSHVRAYSNAVAFQKDLDLLDESLRSNRGASLAEGRLRRLRRMVEVFGFHLATLEIRQHASQHRSAMTELMGSFQIADNYADLDEISRRSILGREIRSTRPFTAQLEFSEGTNETIRLMRLIYESQQRLGPDAMSTYIISMTASVSDVLEVLLLAKDAGLLGRLDIVPLFETIEDLERAPQVMAELFEDPAYRFHLEKRNHRQQIMIGYSDSNKDGGFLRANWMLYAAQRRLAVCAKQRGIQLTLYHGRGGSLGRGGGPANRAILAQPPESVLGRIKVTEQGEVISARYGNTRVAYRHLEQLTHAILISGSRHRSEPDAVRDEWATAMEAISQEAYRSYRALVTHPKFLAFFERVTPIRFIDQMNLGSRPSRRRETKSLEDLRAIPWVFAWTQSRFFLPGWFGSGSGFDSWAKGSSTNPKILCDMYQRWPFFRTLVDNLHLGLARADWSVARLYADAVPEEWVNAFLPTLQTEFELTKKWVLKISGQPSLLQTEPWLKTSIEKRNPYIDPLHGFQVELFRQFMESEGDEEFLSQLNRAVLLSVNGIAAGLQSVG